MANDSCHKPYAISSRRQCQFEQDLLFVLVDFLRSDSRTRLRVTPGIMQRLARAQELRQALVHETPGAHVAGFFLHPHDLRCLLVTSQDLSQELSRKRIEL